MNETKESVVMLLLKLTYAVFPQIISSVEDFMNQGYVIKDVDSDIKLGKDQYKALIYMKNEKLGKKVMIRQFKHSGKVEPIKINIKEISEDE